MVVVGHVNEKGAIPVTRGTPLGNPFPMNHPGERGLVCDKYEEWFKARLNDPGETEFKSYLNRILVLSRKRLVTLGCNCNCYSQNSPFRLGTKEDKNLKTGYQRY